MSPGRPAAGATRIGASVPGHGAWTVRQQNLGALLRILHVAGPTSRARLTQLTGLNRSTIGGLVSELRDRGLAAECGYEVTPGPGRPSTIVEPRPQGAVALAVEFTVDGSASAVVGLGGEILAERRLIRARRSVEPEEAIAETARQIGAMRPAWERAPVVGVGVAVAGLTNRVTGNIDFAPNLAWRDVALGARLSRALTQVGVPGQTPIALANEADLGALAESTRGVGRDVDDLVYVSGEVGIGVGVIAGGQPLLGVAGYAAEAGHLLVNPEGTTCGCGARGCWETEAGERALLRRAGVDPGRVGSEAVEAVLARAAHGDPVAIAAMQETGRWIGIGLGNLVNLFNPRLIVLGGLYHRLLEPLRPAICEALSSRALPVSAAMVELVVSRFGGEALLLGASELVFEGLFDDPVGVVSARTSA